MIELTEDERLFLGIMIVRPMLLTPYAQWLDRALLEQLVKRKMVGAVHHSRGTIYGITRLGLKALAE
jgi:hypothetical protein